jgi:hypothetical protein
MRPVVRAFVCARRRAARQPEHPNVWPGRSAGIRPPSEGETPLSAAEVQFAVTHDLI